MKGIDFSGLVLPIIAVYKNPEDYPNDCVARVFDLERPTNVIIVKESFFGRNLFIKENIG